ncbi:hypothetical protein LguiB_023775 [Lonicera macranthoides]
MEFLNPTIPTPSQFLPRISIFSPKFPITRTWRKKNPSRSTVPYSKSPLNSPFPLYLSLSNSKRFQISAHFGRHTSTRRNSLRKKLTQQQQVRDSPVIYNPSPNFENPVDKFDKDSNLDNGGLKEVNVESNSGVGKDIVESDSLKKLKGDSVMLNQLESWVDQYKADSEFWGVGSGPIFTVFQDSDGKVERVVVNEDEILRRSGVEPLLYKKSGLQDFKKVDSKISHARFVARETEIGNHVFKNSSVAKFVVNLGEQSTFVDGIKGLTLQSVPSSRLSRIGIAVLCGSFVCWALKWLLSEKGKKNKKYTPLQREMLRRKMKARMEKENLVKGSVEVLQDYEEPHIEPIESPRIDKQEIVATVMHVEASSGKLALQKSFGIDSKIQEIRVLARQARELEKMDRLRGDRDGEDDQNVNKLLEVDVIKPNDDDIHNEKQVIQQNGDSDVEDDEDEMPNGMQIDQTVNELPNENIATQQNGDITRFVTGLASVEDIDTQDSSTISKVKVPNDSGRGPRDLKHEYGLNLSKTIEVSKSSETSCSQSSELEKKPGRSKTRVIGSVKEAREYLARKRNKQEENQVCQFRMVQKEDTVLRIPSEKESDGISVNNAFKREELVDNLHLPDKDDGGLQSSTSNGNSDSTLEAKKTLPTVNDDIESSGGIAEEGLQSSTSNGNSDSTLEAKKSIPTVNDDIESSGGITKEVPILNNENWMEKNFNEFEPIAKKIGVGFKDNYMIAKEKANLGLGSSMEMIKPKPEEDDGELDWMKDEKLREIVFQVRENELLGRDPFYLMDAEDKNAFFEGLEKKVEKVNEKLQPLHEFLHSNIENLDYGAAGISVYDPPEKIIPRWKGPPLDKSPEFLNNYEEQRKAVLAQSLRKRDGSNSEESLSLGNTSAASEITFQDQNVPKNRGLKTPKTVIESSDGSLRAGKKSGKEYWSHTKKWSRGFLDSYNAETDPEVKAIMKDIGKDLDRWITEDEIKEAAKMMDGMPTRRRQMIEEKLHNLKREMYTFGPQAVVNKYSEYKEENEEDYFWWLDLPFILCIELHTNEGGVQEAGFYSLEMAAELELNPKQYHVIGFEDTGDSKNLCYIIQSHMEMHGSGKAFVVARPPKEAFREAKASGYGVTVIRKGELQLNVDQTMDEVEEQIIEIGTKMYHDKITKGRSVDISSLMKGVFGPNKRTKRTPTKTEGKRIAIAERNKLKKKLKQLKQKLKQIKIKPKPEPEPTNQ